MNLTHKLILGTAQFGMDYGINNNSGQVSKEEVCKILHFAYRQDVCMLDTSSAYGNSESVLGNELTDKSLKFNVISKYPRSSQHVESILRKTLLDLRQSTLHGYLIHHFDFFQEKPAIWEEMIFVKEIGLTEKIGFSLYSCEQLQYLFDNDIKFDLLQIPYNIFDRRFEPYFDELKKRNVTIHTRSVFLQGLFFRNINLLDKKFAPLIPYLNELNNYCHEIEITIEELVLRYVISNPYIDGVLIGIDNCEQLKSNINTLNRGVTSQDIDFVKSLKIKETQLLNPANW
jgi:aryl-alcohol dehydrogenase-like predicted oxidoreductase